MWGRNLLPWSFSLLFAQGLTGLSQRSHSLWNSTRAESVGTASLSLYMSRSLKRTVLRMDWHQRGSFRATGEYKPLRFKLTIFKLKSFPSAWRGILPTSRNRGDLSLSLVQNLLVGSWNFDVYPNIYSNVTDNSHFLHTEMQIPCHIRSQRFYSFYYFNCN